MFTAVKHAFIQRNNREQALLLAMLVCVSLYGLFFVLIQPLNRYVDQQSAQMLSVQDSLARVQRLTAQVQQASDATAVTQSSNRSLAQMVDQTLKANNLTMRGFQTGQNGEVRLRLDNVAYSALLQWLYDMEVGQGVEITSLSLSMGKEGGTVMANVSLRRGNS